MKDKQKDSTSSNNNYSQDPIHREKEWQHLCQQDDLWGHS